MIITTSVFLVISGIFAAIAKVRNNTKASEFIAAYILGISTLILTKDYLVDEAGPNQTLVLLLIAVLSVSFALGEFLKNKSQLGFLIIPVLLSGVVLLYPQMALHSYMGHQIDDIYVLALIAFVSASAPIIIHLINKVIQFLITKISPIQWNKTDSNLFEGALAFLFIGGMAALGGFLLGKIGILIAATFFLSTSFLSRNKTSISSGILISTSGALFLISVAFVVMQQAGYKSLDLTNGEVIEGFFIGGFIVLIYDLIIKLAQQSDGKWKVILTIKAILIPLLFIFLLGFAYTQLERLGGVLTLTALLISIGVLSIIYSTFKSDSNIIGLKLFSLGFVLMIAPYFAPVKQTSEIDLGALGIEQSGEGNDDEAQNQSYHEKLDEPNGKVLSNAIGNWKIDEEKSKIFFELGPPDGRTSGEFQKVTGNFNVTKNISNATIKVILPVKQISTYNSMRDESLMDIEYFHEEKYPELTFESKKFRKNGDAYEVEGMFTLLGISKPLDLTLKMVGVGEQDNNKVMVLWGKASLNRTDYGMPSSAKVGDVVDFHFEVQLTK